MEKRGEGINKINKFAITINEAVREVTTTIPTKQEYQNIYQQIKEKDDDRQLKKYLREHTNDTFQEY